MRLEYSGIFWTPGFAHDSLMAPFAFQEESGTLAFALCEGSETGWDVSSRVSHLIARHIVHTLQRHTESPNEAFVQAAFSARDILKTQFPAVHDVGAAGCTAIGGVIQDNRVWISWIGSESAWHFRKARRIAATRAHTMANAALAEVISDPWMATMPTRLIHAEIGLNINQIETLVYPWELMPGDALIVTSADLAYYLNPQALADDFDEPPASTARKLIAAFPQEAKPRGLPAAIVIRAHAS